MKDKSIESTLESPPLKKGVAAGRGIYSNRNLY